MSTQVNPAKETYETLTEDTVIKIPQYKNALTVTSANHSGGLVGVEFVDNKTSASKMLIQNVNSGRIYLVAGSTDKGEVKEIEIVTQPTDGDENDDEDEKSEDDKNNEDSEDDEDDSSTIHAWGDGRRKTLAAIDEKSQLDPLKNPTEITEITDALEEIALERVWSEPTDVIEKVKSTHERLPDDAKSHYVTDRVLLRRLNAARRQFNKWMGKRKRYAQMPSWVEAGPANYPASKSRRLSRYERDASEELREKIKKVDSAARGGRQRALNAIGSSVAEQNEQAAKSEREQMRDKLETDDLVHFRNPNLRYGEVIRVNKKTVTVRYPNPFAGRTKPMSDEPAPDYRKQRVDLDSNHLIRFSDERLQNVDEIEYSSLAEMRDDLFSDESE